MNKPSAFISYAHKDATEFTRRLAFALEFYADVFWDIRIQAGEFPKELEREIETRDFFVAMMSPYSQLEGGWCRKELKHAQKCDRRIVPVRIYSQHKDDDLEKTYTYADFTADFDQGFRRLTYLLLGEARSSWEYMGMNGTDIQTLLSSLQDGHLPGLIAKEVSEWAIVDQLWPSVQRQLSNTRMLMGLPRTPRGILEQLPSLRKQIAQMRDAASMHWVGEAQSIIEDHLNRFSEISDNQHGEAGANALRTIVSIHDFFEQNAAAKLDAMGVAEIQSFFYFNIAEKLRELIVSHARRSRYLY